MSDSALRRRLTVSRRPARPGDIPLLRSLFADAHIELMVLPSDTRFVLIDMQFRAQRRQHSAQFPTAHHDILVVDGVEVGRVLVDRSAGSVRIVDLSIALGRRREGIATAVLAEIMDDAAAAGQPVGLTIWAGNTAARALCERAGLHVTDDEAGYLTMERTTTPVAQPSSNALRPPGRG
jgi:RimJ/RimL family protein N-acetyltransferase